MILNFSFSPVSPEESNKKHPFPCPTSYRTALTYYLDITNPPRTNVLYELAQYATDAGEQERLRKMASSAAEGKVGALPSPARLSWGLGDPQKAPKEPRGSVCQPCGEVVMPCLPAGAVPQLGGGGPQEHPGHPAGHALPAPPHRPPVRAPAPPAGPLLLHRLLLQGGCASSRECGCGGTASAAAPLSWALGTGSFS